jgi:hypothetical protein
MVNVWVKESSLEKTRMNMCVTIAKSYRNLLLSIPAVHWWLGDSVDQSCSRESLLAFSQMNHFQQMQ